MKLPSEKQKVKGKVTRVVLPVEEIFDVLLRIHRNHRHKRRDMNINNVV